MIYLTSNVKAVKMGAWGMGLFQSYQDLDIVSELSDEAGLTELEEKANAKAVAANKGEDAEKDNEAYYSIYGGMCSDPELVRKHLDSGILIKMLAKYQAKLLYGETEAFRQPGYIFMLLGACAMSLGCTIPVHFKNVMQKIYTCVELPSDAIKQMDKALNASGGYKAGEMYNFDSPGLIETANMSAEKRESNSSGFVGLNVWGPGTLFYNPPKGSVAGLKELRAKFKADELYAKDVCGGCGVETTGDGEGLLTCAKCRSRKYCSKQCQKQQWKMHKKVCKAPTTGQEKKAL